MKSISVFCCLLYATWAKGARINAEGYEGEEVSFLCSHLLAWKNHKYFCKDECKTTEDILVTVKPGSRTELGRISLVDLGTGAFTVTFSHLELSDSGKYWCGVDRPGIDTYIAVILTVKEVTASETTVKPDVLTTWTFQDISNATQLPFEQLISYTSGSTNQSIASNCTNGEQSTTTSIVLYTSVVVIFFIVILTVLVLAVRSRKCTDFVGTYKRELDCDYINTNEIKKTSWKTSCDHNRKQDPPTSLSTKAECNGTDHIYENVCRNPAGPRKISCKPC